MNHIPTEENSRVEFKESISKLEREIVAFANSNGGTIYIGINDAGKRVSFELTNSNRSQIINAIRNCQPQPQFEIKENDGFVELQIFEGHAKPYRAPNGFYMRFGATSQKLTRDEIINFYIRENVLSFDSAISRITLLNATKDEFNFSTFERFRELSKVGIGLTNEQLLENLGLIVVKDSQPFITNGAMLLFGDSPEKKFRTARVLLWHMENESSILDQRLITGGLFTQLEKAMVAIKDVLATRYVIDSLERREELEVPEFVLRELLVNALIHRDYFEQSSEIQIKIFPEFLEISNPGTVLHNLSVSQVFGKSFRRNVLLGEVFHRRGFIERAGTGLLRVRNYYSENELGKYFNISQFGPLFIARIPRMRLGIRKEKVLVSERSYDENLFSQRQRDILNVLKSKKAISTVEYANKYNISERYARKELKALVDSERIKKVRKGKNVIYLLK